MKSKIKVIDSLWTFIVAVAFLGPFALPLLWRNPRFSLEKKVLGSLFILGFTWYLLLFSEYMLKDSAERLKNARETTQSETALSNPPLENLSEVQPTPPTQLQQDSPSMTQDSPQQNNSPTPQPSPLSQ